MTAPKRPAVVRHRYPRFASGSPIYVIELKHPKAWRLACGVNTEPTAWFKLKEAVAYRSMVEGRGIPCRIVRYAAGGVVSFRRKWERRLSTRSAKRKGKR